MSAQQSEPDLVIHELRNGKDCHYFRKHVDPDLLQTVWLCDCGEMRDSAGRPIQT